MENALLNLALNARDAMVDGGAITICTANRVVHDDEASSGEEGISPGRFAVVSVSDNGPGMPEDVAERAFEPFFTTKGVGEGTGLGLSMVYGFAKQSGGHVELDSTPGEGTTIRMYLPASIQDLGIEEAPGIADARKAPPRPTLVAV